MPGKWIKVPPRPNIPETECETEGCDNPSHGHEFCINCFRVKIHHLAFCDDCGACHEDVIKDCNECKWIDDFEPGHKLCHEAKCKHKWNTLNYRSPIVAKQYRSKGCTCNEAGTHHEVSRPCKVHRNIPEDSDD